MQCVILAAGKGMRLRPLTNDRPKPMVEVAGRPILEHILDALPAAIDSVVLVVKYRAEKIREHFGPLYQGMLLSYVEQFEPMGTGGALLAARPHLNDRFMVIPADDLHGPHALEAMLQYRHALLAVQTSTPELFGTLSLHDDGTLASIEEKPERPTTNLVNTSVMMLDKRVFDYTVPVVGDELRLTDMVTALTADVPVHIVEQDMWQTVGKPEDLPHAETFVRQILR